MHLLQEGVFLVMRIMYYIETMLYVFCLRLKDPFSFYSNSCFHIISNEKKVIV
jgi:hypothetical protein